jgi:CDP-diacylglycerol pyrophosphatase
MTERPPPVRTSFGVSHARCYSNQDFDGQKSDIFRAISVKITRTQNTLTVHGNCAHAWLL